MKKFVALLLCMVMSVAMIGTLAFADEAETLNPEEAAAAEGESSGGQSPLEALLSSDDLKTVEVPLSENGEVELDDYSVIEIPENLVSVTDEDVANYINSMISYSTTTEIISEGTAEDGDTVNIDFSGRLADEEDPFDGGTAQGYDLVLGSGSFIPGFEEQLVGHALGETFDINVTFPEEYAEDLAGKDAIFTVTLNYKSITVVPELDDAFVQSFSSENLDVELNTVAELEDYTRDYLYNTQLKNAIMNVMQEKTHVISYNESQFELLKAYSMESLDYYAAMYASYGLEGYDVDMVAKMSGFANADAYASDEATYYLNVIMMLDKVAQDKGIEITDEEVDETVADFMASYGYDETYSIEEFKEMSGDAWVLLISKMNVLYAKVMDALVPNTVLVEAQEDDTADSTVYEASEQEEAVDEESAE